MHGVSLGRCPGLSWGPGENIFPAAVVSFCPAVPSRLAWSPGPRACCLTRACTSGHMSPPGRKKGAREPGVFSIQAQGAQLGSSASSVLCWLPGRPGQSATAWGLDSTFALHFWGWKSRVGLGWAPAEAPEDASSCPFQLPVWPALLAVPWLVDASPSLCLCPRTMSSTCVL